MTRALTVLRTETIPATIGAVHGVGLAAAILVDATLVRTVLLPATMKLPGRWNWELPRLRAPVRP